MPERNDDAEGLGLNDQEYAYLGQRIRQLLKVDIDHYRERQMRRRLTAFVAQRANGDVMSFLRELERDERMLKELHDMLTIHVSEFFRDTVQFQHLKSRVLPELLRKARRLRVWSAACSHGAEPYSTAIILHELGHSNGYSMVATDVDEGILERAMAGGPYLESETKNVSADQLARFFKPGRGGRWVTSHMRSRVQFQRHDLLAEEPPGAFDLIVCRNVIIYFSTDARRELLEKFRESLRPGGVLFLGGTEALLESGIGFDRMFDSFYRKTDADQVEAAQRRAA